MVRATGRVVLMMVLLGSDGRAHATEAPASFPAFGPLRSALARGKYPWYDARTDSARPLLPSWEFDWSWLPDWLFRRKISGFGSLGETFGYVLAAIALAALLYVLWVLWRLYEPSAEEALQRAASTGAAERLEALPEGLRPESDDPWNEAKRRRARGDDAGAIICLFAHQLLTLDRRRQIRLSPGRTGRQLVRTIGDPQLRAWVEPTLRLFEAVYYGHHVPEPEAYDQVWALAERFEEHLAAEGPLS